MPISFETLRIIRPANCLLAAAGVLVGAYLTPVAVRYYGPAVASVAAFFVCAGGNVINDLCDIEIDRVNRPDRVLVRGGLSRGYALRLAVVLNLLALLFAAAVSGAVLGVVAAAIGLLLFYNLRAKRLPLAGNIVIAVLGAMTFITGGLATDTAETWRLPGPLIPAMFAFLLHLNREIIKDAEDIAGDRASGVVTLPQVIGLKSSLWLALALHLILVVLTMVPVFAGWYSRTYMAITLYIIDLPLTVGLLSIIAKPSRRRLRYGSLALKAAMVVGAVALLLA